MKIHSILLAGGSSDRFNNEENKVYFPIGGKPALSWALETLDNSDKVDSILLVVRDEDWEKTNNVIELVNPKKLSGVTMQETIVEIQTPQIFPASELWKSYELAKLDNWQALDTTECVSKYSKLEAVVIPGDPRNMKVTFIEDIFILEEMI